MVMRWLLLKDLQILRRSPLLVATLVLYPAVIALLVGFAISSPPGKPKVAIYSGFGESQGNVQFGNQQINVSKYEGELYKSIQPIHASTPAEAIADVRQGDALAALIIPADIGKQIQDLVQHGTGSPTIRVVVNNRNPLERQLVQQAIQTRIAEVERAIAKQVIGVAIGDLHKVLSGGDISLLGKPTTLLGLVKSRKLVSDAVATLPKNSAQAARLQSVVDFANVAIAGLTFATPVLNRIGNPLTVKQTQLAGKTTPSASYAAAIAVVFLLMFVALLLAAGMLALERSENAYGRLIAGLVRPWGLLTEKIVLATSCAVIETFLVAAALSIFVPLDWARVELWIAALVIAGVAFGALGVAVGGLARDVSIASLLAFLISLPVAFAALVPGTAVSSALAGVLDVISFVFPFRSALEAVSNAFGGVGSAGDAGLALLHLAVLAVVFAGLARLSLKRFASR